MNRDELRKMVALGEDSRRQFKADVTNVDSLAADLVAFSNSNGGTILIGVADDGALKGLLPYHGLGSGIKRALEQWPQIDFTDDREGCLFTATVRRVIKAKIERQPPTQSPTQSGDPVERLIQVLSGGEFSTAELREALRIKHRHTFRHNYLHPALKRGLIEHTIPDKPNSRFQKYRLTATGRTLLAGLGDGEKG